MDFYFLKGLIVLLLIQRCESEGPSTSSLPSTAAVPQDGKALPREPELTPGEVVPVVAPPSLKEVEQAVQEATEQAEGRGAEEVLKELLERVVEAALGEAGGAGLLDEAESAEEAMAAPEDGEAEAGAEVGVTEQAAEEEEVVEDTGAKAGETGGGEEQEVAAPGVEEVNGDVEVVEAVVEAAEEEEEEGIVEVEGKTAADSVEEATAGVDVGGADEGEAVAGASPPEPEVSQEVADETVAVLEEVEREVAPEEAGGEGAERPEVLPSEETGAAETEVRDTEEALEVETGEGEQEPVADSDPGLGADDVAPAGDAGAEGEAGGDETQGGDDEGGAGVAQLPPGDYEEIESTQSVVGEPIEEEEEKEEEGEDAAVKETEGEEEQGALVVEGGVAEEVGEGEAGAAAAGGEAGGVSAPEEESEAPVNEEEVDRQGAEAGEELTAAESSHAGQAEDQEVLVIPAQEPAGGTAGGDETSTEQRPEDSPLSPSLGGGETGSNDMGSEEIQKEESNHANKITSADDLLTHDPTLAKPMLDNFVDEVPATPTQSEGEEPGKANELVEDTAGTSEEGELGLEAWKIGAISAAVFLVLETVVIIVYIVKCRNRSNSSPAPQQACEEGCVEPEAATGGDCSDDTLPAGNGDSQPMAALDPSDVAPTPGRHKEQGTVMVDLPPGSASPRRGPDPSQDLRTSVL